MTILKEGNVQVDPYLEMTPNYLINYLVDSGVDVKVFTPERLELDLGEVHIEVDNVKKPHQSWNNNARRSILDARKSYWERWGMVPLEDGLDAVSYVDIAHITYPDPENGNAMLSEGLTMRTVTINSTPGDEGLPDDLRFFVGPDNRPLLELLTEHFFDDDTKLARDKVVAASRVAPIRPVSGKHNIYTPEAFASLQVLVANRAHIEGVEIIVNTMREDMSENVLSLPDGTHYDHVRTESALGLQIDSVKLNRQDPYVCKHIFSYLGYFGETEDIKALISHLITSPVAKLDERTLLTQNIDPTKLENLRPSQVKNLIQLVNIDGHITARLTGDELRAMILEYVRDAAHSYTMTTRQRMASGLKVLKASYQARSGFS